MKKKRINWIDTAKCLGMFLVIFNHLCIAFGNNPVMFTIASFFMPFFFVASGLNMKNGKLSIEEFRQYFIKKFISLYVPYFLWALIYTDSVDLKNIGYILYGSNLSLSLAHSNAVLWFLPCLFASTIMTRLQLSLCTGSSKNTCLKAALLAVLNVTAGWGATKLLYKFPVYHYPMSLNVALVSNGFILAGYIIGVFLKERSMFGDGETGSWEWLIFFGSFIGLTAAAFLNKGAINSIYHRVAMALSSWGNTGLFMASGIFGSLTVFELSRLVLNKIPFLNLIGRESIGIMAVHFNLAAGVAGIINTVNTPVVFKYLMFTLIITSAVIEIISFLISVCIRKAAPNLLGER